MEEQEVCSDIVAKSKEESSGRIEGESLLLPLLQGLLDAPDNEQTADSGTESGEDLRSGLIIEVQNVLDKLANSLKSDSNDMTTDRRSSLLQLVTRLQTGLAVQPASANERRGSSGPNRFARRKRQNRHTVGVSSEELEDARKLMAEIRLCDPLNSGSSTPSRAPQLPLQKQNSEGSVLQRTSQFRAVPTNQNKYAVKNAVAKPYGSSASTSQSHSGTSSTVDTPTEASDALEFPSVRLEAKPGEPMTYHNPAQVQTREKKSQYAVLQHSASLEIKKTDPKQKPPATVSSNFSPEIEKKSVPKPAQYVTNPLSQIQIENNGSTQESETDEDPITIKGKQTPVAIAVQPQLEEQKLFHNPVQQYESKTNMVLQSNPIYSKPKTPEPEQDPKMNNKFNNKKLKMKRANTIDIPKPLDFYESEDDYDSDTSLVDRQSSRRSNYLALRGPIRVGKNNASNTNVPVFEPKTDSDRKFLAFISKHNDDSNNKGSLWAGQAQPSAKHGPNWNNRFGHIRTAFEKASTSTPSTPNTNVSSARNFWKSADDAVSAGKPSYNGPKVSKQGARDLQQMFEDRDRQVQQKSPYSSSDEKNIVTGTLKVDTKGFDAKKNYKLVSQPQPVNKFSHAPTSAFAAIPKKNGPQVISVTQTVPSSKNVIQPPPSSINEPIKPGKVVVPENIVKTDYKENDSGNPTPLYLYSPKPLQTSPQSVSSSTSPSTTPWANSTNEHRVQKLAASKFESPVVKGPPVIKPRRLSKDKTFSPSAFQQPPPDEKLTAPYLVKSADKASTVRKLSDQFNSKTSQAPEFNSKTSQAPEAYSTFTTVKYGFTSPNNQSLSSYQPQNYSISYANQKHQSYPPKQIDNEPSKTYSRPQAQSYHKYQPEQTQNYSHQPNKQKSYQKYSNEDPQKYSQSTPIYQAQYQPRSNSMKIKSSDTHNYSNQPQNNSFKYNKSQQLPTNDTKPYEYSSKPQNSSVPYNQPHKLPTSEAKPQNYSMQYNQSQNLHTTPKVYQAQTQTQPQEYTSQQFIQFNQPKPTQETQKYPSSQVKQKQDALKIHDLSSPDSSPTPQPQYKRQTSQESVKEYEAAVTRVMKGPVSHQAVTVQQKGPKGRDEHDMEAAFNLKSVLQKFSQPDKPIQDNVRPKKVASNHTHSDNTERKLSIDSAVIAQNKSSKAAAASTNLQRTQSFKKTNAGQIAPDFMVNGKPLSMESTEINEDGESIITSKFHIPVVTVNTKPQVLKPVPKPEPPKIISPTKNMLSKSDSWHQLMHEQQQMQQKPSPRSSPNFKPVGRSKSSHTLAVPTIQFQAGMTKDEVTQKKRTVEAYFSGKLSPQSLSKSPSDESLDKSDKVEVKASKTTINRKKTSEKVSIHKHTGILRSRTLPSIVCPNLLDESNVEAAFEDLFRSNA